MPVELVNSAEVKCCIDYMLEKQLAAQTINGYLIVIRRFYHYLQQEENIMIENPAIKGMSLCLSKPLCSFSGLIINEATLGRKFLTYGQNARKTQEHNELI